MRERLGRLPLRVRLVAGFVAAMLVLLSVAAGFVYWRVEYALDRGLDVELDRATATISPLVDAAGQVTTPTSANATGTAWQVLDAEGRVLDAGGAAPADPLVPAGDLAQVGSGTLITEVGDLLPAADRPYRLHITALGAGPAEGSATYLLVGVRRDHRDEALRELVLQLALAGLGALAVASLVGDLLARSSLRPVERYRRRAEEIAGGADGLRLEVPEGRDDEVTRLGNTLNEMLAALERSLAHERRFVDNASHELRTPLTLLQSRIQLARRRTRGVAEHEAILDELAVDVTRLVDLAEQLLALGAAAPEAAGQADAAWVVASVVDRRRLALPDRAHEIAVELPTTPCFAAIEPLALERVVTNLVDNALRHGQATVVIRVRIAPEPGHWVVVDVQDAGAGMSAELLTHATGRFTRSAEARARPGAGLGLSLVEQMVEAAGGDLRLCHGGTHTQHGHPAPVECRHDEAMTVTVVLPGLPPGEAGS